MAKALATKSKGESKGKQVRQKMDMPAGAIVDLAGVKNISGWGDNMSIQSYRGTIALDGVREETSGPSRGPAAVQHVPAAKEQGEAKTGLGDGHSQVFIQPLSLNRAFLNGLPSSSEEMGVIVGSARYFFNAAFQRAEGGAWAPIKGAPARHQWYCTDAQGAAQHPDIVKLVFEPVLKAVELYYRANYRDFVLAELAWYNNTLLEFETAAERVRTGKAKEEEKAAFYRFRFSGHASACREAEQQLRVWLKENER